jgi:Lar family restriction alleviation protein
MLGAAPIPNEDTMTDLMPCPQCGGTELSIEASEEDEGVVAFIRCDDCGAEGPMSKPCATDDEAENDAVRAWNEFASKGKP